jgi:RecB family exonuclease
VNQLPFPREEPLPRRLSVTSLVELRRCPRRFAFAEVEGHARRAPAKATLGVAVHRAIQISHGAPKDPDEPARDRDPTRPFVEAFLRSPFATRRLVAAELPIRLRFGEFIIYGRIDAVFAGDDPRSWELVDFKTGAAPSVVDPADEAQLEIYAIAAIRSFGREPHLLATTYLHLATGETRTRQWSADLAGEAEARLERDMALIVAHDYPAQPNRCCVSCDALEVCPPGQASLAAP